MVRLITKLPIFHSRVSPENPADIGSLGITSNNEIGREGKNRQNNGQDD